MEVQGHKAVTGVIALSSGFSLALAHKDLKLACDFAFELDVPTFYASLSRDLHRIAISRLGGVCPSVESIASLVEAMAGVELNSG